MRKTRAAFILFVVFFILLLISFFLVERREVRIVLPEAPKAEGPPPARTRPQAQAPVKPIRPSPAPPAGEVLAAIIIDDLGYNLDYASLLCGLGRPVTAAILPFAPQTRDTASLAAGCGLEIMLHLPLESLVPKEESAGRISSGMSAAEVRARVLECIDQVPGCRGVNNHEGSRTTEDAVLMPEILAALRERGMYFIDSLTTADSIAYETARRMGVPAAVRRIFLDGDPGGEEAVRRKIVELFQAARIHGRAVAIGHARRETLSALRKYLGLAADFGVTLVPASRLVE
jgi:uncharacterized protein